MKKRTFYLLLVALIVSGTLFAQNIKVEGVVFDKKTGDALIGATVMQKGTSNGTTTNLDGKFALAMPTGSTLVISYLGYIGQELVINNDSQLRIELVSNTQNLDEVIVVGYGTQDKKEITSSVTSVKAEAFNKGNVNDPAQLLAGGPSVVTAAEVVVAPEVRRLLRLFDPTLENPLARR